MIYCQSLREISTSVNFLKRLTSNSRFYHIIRSSNQGGKIRNTMLVWHMGIFRSRLIGKWGPAGVPFDINIGMVTTSVKRKGEVNG